VKRRRQFPAVTRELLGLRYGNAGCGYGRLWNMRVREALPVGNGARELVADTEWYIGFLGPVNIDVALSLSLDGCDPSELP
jgi:hypothetical protein